MHALLMSNCCVAAAAAEKATAVRSINYKLKKSIWCDEKEENEGRVKRKGVRRSRLRRRKLTRRKREKREQKMSVEQVMAEEQGQQDHETEQGLTEGAEKVWE